MKNKRDIKWLTILPVVIVMGFFMPRPLGAVQSVVAALLFGFKVGQRFL